MQIPTLDTARMTLEPPTMDDLPALVAWFKSPRSAFIGGPIHDTSDVWAALLRTAGHWHLRGYGFWHLHDKASGVMCGYIGFLHHVDWPEAELCWGVYDGFEGRGYAFEAAVAARDYGAENFGLRAPLSIIDVDNPRSITLAKRLGATLEKTTFLQGQEAHFFRHPTHKRAIQ